MAFLAGAFTRTVLGQDVKFQIVDIDGVLQYKSTWGPESGRVQITYKVPWYQRREARVYLIGRMRFIDALPQYGYFNRVLPYAPDEGDGKMFCKTCEITPWVTQD